MVDNQTIDALLQDSLKQLAGTIFNVTPPNSQEDRFDGNLKKSPDGRVTFTSRTAQRTAQETRYTTRLVEYKSEDKTTKVMLEENVSIPEDIGRWERLASRLLGDDWRFSRFGAFVDYDFIREDVIVAHNIAFPADFVSWPSFAIGCTSNMTPQVPRRGQIVLYEQDPTSPTPKRKKVFDLTTMLYQHIVDLSDSGQEEKLKATGFSDVQGAKAILAGQYKNSHGSDNWPRLGIDGSSEFFYDRERGQVIFRHYSHGCFHSATYYQILDLSQNPVGHEFTYVADRAQDQYKERLEQLIENPQDLVIEAQGGTLSLKKRNQPETAQIIGRTQSPGYWAKDWQLHPEKPLTGDLHRVPYNLPRLRRNDYIRKKAAHQASDTQTLFSLGGRIYCIERS